MVNDFGVLSRPDWLIEAEEYTFNKNTFVAKKILHVPEVVDVPVVTIKEVKEVPVKVVKPQKWESVSVRKERVRLRAKKRDGEARLQEGILRDAALALGEKTYVTHMMCVKKHLTRYVSSTACCDCATAHNREYKLKKYGCVHGTK